MQEHVITPEQQAMFLTISTDGKRTVIPYIAEKVWLYKDTFSNRNSHHQMLTRQMISNHAISIYEDRWVQPLPSLYDYAFIATYLTDYAEVQGETDIDKKRSAQERLDAYQERSEQDIHLLTTAALVLTNVVNHFVPSPNSHLSRA